MKTIVVLNGSPRELGNTELLVNAFANGAEQAGAKVVKVNLRDLEYSDCIACNLCKESGNCCFEDDMVDVLAQIKEADALVLASPMYMYGLTGKLKCAQDRMHGMGESKIKQTGMLLCCGDSDASAFAPVIAAHKMSAAYDGWEYVGDVQAVAVNEKGEVLNTNFLEKAEELGERFAK